MVHQLIGHCLIPLDPWHDCLQIDDKIRCNSVNKQVMCHISKKLFSIRNYWRAHGGIDEGRGEG